MHNSIFSTTRSNPIAWSFVAASWSRVREDISISQELTIDLSARWSTQPTHVGVYNDADSGSPIKGFSLLKETLLRTAKKLVELAESLDEDWADWARSSRTGRQVKRSAQRFTSRSPDMPIGGCLGTSSATRKSAALAERRAEQLHADRQRL